MKKFSLIAILALSLASVIGQSTAEFPTTLDEWVLVKASIIPGRDVEIPKNTPMFLQETV